MDPWNAQRSEKGTWRTPPPWRVTFWSLFAKCSQKCDFMLFFCSLFQVAGKVHKIMGKNTNNGVILGSPTLNPIEPARSDRMSAVFSQSWKKCSKMTPKVSHFGVILGAKFATILLFGRPGEQIRRKTGVSKKRA